MISIEPHPVVTPKDAAQTFAYMLGIPGIDMVQLTSDES